MRSVIWLSTLLLFGAGSAAAETQNTTGNHNVSIQGSGNNVTIRYEGSETAAPQSVYLVVGSNGTPIVSGSVNWSTINPALSTFTEIDDDHVVDAQMDNVFDDEKVKLNAGEHFYTMGVEFAYWNGSFQKTECSGVIDAKASAAILPKLFVAQNFMNGQLSPLNCGFVLR